MVAKKQKNSTKTAAKKKAPAQRSPKKAVAKKAAVAKKGGAITLRGAVGLPLAPAPLKDSALIIIDAQVTYTEGPLKLDGIEKALKNCQAVLERARKAKIPIFHIQHDAGPGSAYDVKGRSGSICDEVKPKAGEAIIVKNYPNSFEKTDLEAKLKAKGAKNLILVGFMTHCCINSTARCAFNMGYNSVTVIGDCTATRDLPNPMAWAAGKVIPAAQQQAAALAAVNDLHCNVVPSAASIA